MKFLRMCFYYINVDIILLSTILLWRESNLFVNRIVLQIFQNIISYAQDIVQCIKTGIAFRLIM